MSMPTDNSKEYFVKDFYKRTLNILRSTQCEYDVALLINSMVGLLVVPKERYFHSMYVPDNYVDSDILKKIRTTFKSNPDIPLTQILRRLRNSVYHGNMEYEYRDDMVSCEYGYYKLKNKSIDIEGEI